MLQSDEVIFSNIFMVEAFSILLAAPAAIKNLCDLTTQYAGIDLSNLLFAGECGVCPVILDSEVIRNSIGVSEPVFGAVPCWLKLLSNLGVKKELFQDLVGAATKNLVISIQGQLAARTSRRFMIELALRLGNKSILGCKKEQIPNEIDLGVGKIIFFKDGHLNGAHYEYKAISEDLQSRPDLMVNLKNGSTCENVNLKGKECNDVYIFYLAEHYGSCKQSSDTDADYYDPKVLDDNYTQMSKWLVKRVSSLADEHASSEKQNELKLMKSACANINTHNRWPGDVVIHLNQAEHFLNDNETLVQEIIKVRNAANVVKSYLKELPSWFSEIQDFDDEIWLA